MNVLYPALEYSGLFFSLNKTELSKELCDWLDDFKPDVIYAQTATRDGILFCSSLLSYLKKPLIFHMMDDWPSTISDKGLFRKYWDRKIDGEFRKLIEKADVLMSISDEMGNEYKRRYNRDFITFHNPIDISFWKKFQKTSYELNKNATILYAGRIGLGIESSLELIAKAIQIVNDELNISIRFVLQTKESPHWINNYKCVVHNEFVSYEDLPRVFSETDFLLLPYDFSEKSIKYIQFSMPTKAPEYMVSGSPIIIFAPDVTTIVKYAEKYDWAVVVKVKNLGEITKTIKRLLEDKELRQRVAQNAIRVAEINHNSIRVTDNFRKVIFSLVPDQN